MKTCLRILSLLMIFFSVFKAPYALAQGLYALLPGNKMILLDNPANTASVQGPYDVNGVADGELLLAVDARPSSGLLYALGHDNQSSRAQLYLIAIAGASYTASPVGAAFNLSTGNINTIGFDFDALSPTTIHLTANGRDYLLNAESGVLSPVKNTVNYVNRGDISSGKIPSVATIAHSNSIPGADRSVLYGYDLAQNTIIAYDSLHKALTTVGASGLALNTNSTVSIDLYYNTTNHRNTAYLSAAEKGIATTLYSIDERTGVADSLGIIGDGSYSIQDIAIAIVPLSIPQSVNGNMVVALGVNRKQLLFFDSEMPELIRNIVRINGITPGQQIIAIDYRPLDMNLYGLGYNNASGQYQLYFIDATTGIASAINTPATLPIGNQNANAIGFDFDPVADYIRIISTNGLNIRMSPNSGQIIYNDNMYSYVAGDASYGMAPRISTIAHTNSFKGTSYSQVVGLDLSSGSIFNFTAANDGTMSTMLNLGTIVGTGNTANAYLDTYFDSTDGSNSAYLATNTNFGGEPYAGFYAVNPVSGIAQFIGNIGGGIPVRDIAVQPRFTGLAVSAAAAYRGQDFFMYPNPAYNQTRIIMPAVARNPVHAYITDLQGAVVNQYTYAPGGDQIDIDLTALRNGTYSIRIYEEGSTAQILTLIKQ